MTPRALYRLVALFLALLVISSIADAGRSNVSGRVAVSNRVNPKFLPSGTTIWFRADQGITLGGTPLASGTSPPAVTLTGNLVLAAGLQIQVNDVSGGTARGQAKFRWSLDNGSTFVATGVLTAATVTLSGAAAAVVVNFPVGTYAADNKYEATVANWADLSGNGFDVSNDDSAGKQAQPRYFSSVAVLGNQPALLFDAARVTTNFSSVLFRTTGACGTQPNTVFAVTNNLDNSGASVIMTNTAPTSQVINLRNPNTLRLTTNATTLTSVVLQPPAMQNVTNVWTAIFNSTSSLARQNGVQILSGDVGTANQTGIMIGCNNVVGCTKPVGYLPEYIGVAGALTTAQLQQYERYLYQRYGFGAP